MLWFIFALLTSIAWGSADLFYKKGSDSKDKYSHLKIVVMVGLVMGIHGLYYMISNGITFNPIHIIHYFPVSALYILSMTIGYIGLRYIELSISSPVQNSSGAITAILCFVFFKQDLSALSIIAIVMLTSGIILIGIFEKMEETKANGLINKAFDKKYQIGFIAIIFPILYSIIDGLGTFADVVYLDELQLIGEVDALLAYEFTFFICGVIAFLFLTVVKKQKFNIMKEKDKGFAAIFETIGQFFYVFAMAGNGVVAAPLIASYSIFSIIFSRIFLKEKLSKKQYLVVAYVILGIILLGVAEEL